MNFARCIRCQKEVRLPHSTAAIWVRCPLCGEDYAIEDLLEQLPPRLLVVPPPSVDASLFPEDRTEPHLANELQLSDVSTLIAGEASPPSTHPDEREGGVNIPSPSTLHANRRKKQADPAWYAALKIVLGGLLGLVLGQFVLWWLPPPYRADPFNMAERLPDAASFVLPPGLRRERPPVEDGGTQGNLGSDQRSPARGEEEGMGEKDESPSASAGRLLVGLADAPKYRLPELHQALEEARTSFGQVNHDAGSWISSMSELAYRVTFADSRETNLSQFADRVHGFLDDIATSGPRMRELADASSSILTRADEHRDAIVVVGQVREIEQAGQLFEIGIESGSGSEQTARVMSLVDPRTAPRPFGVGDQVIVLGVTVKDPSMFLLGYRGSSEFVIFGGFSHRLSDELDREAEARTVDGSNSQISKKTALSGD